MSQYLTPQYLFDLFVALGGIAFIFAQVRLGKNQKISTSESDALATIQLKDARISELTGKVEELTKAVIQDGKDIAVLQAENTQLRAYNSVRNPELETLMKQVIAALADQTKAINLLLKTPMTATVINNQTPA